MKPDEIHPEVILRAVPQSTLPAEPGRYLFCGSREGRVRLDEYESRFHHRVEIVRIGYDGQGKLRYTGDDFFWNPSKAVGVWIRLDSLEEQLISAADPLLFDAAVRNDIAERADSLGGSSWTMSKEGLVRALLQQNLGQVTDLSVLECAVDRAIELGLLEEKEPGRWIPRRTP